MNIQVKCFATLAPKMPENSDEFPVEHGDTVRSVAERLGIDEEEVHLIFINSARADMDSKLTDGDRLGLFPAVGGG